MADIESNFALPDYAPSLDIQKNIANPSAPLLDQPPNYADVSCVPTGSCLFRHEVQADSEVCTFPIKRNTEGVVCNVYELQHNPDSLWRYFLHYLREKPEFLVHIKGTHKEVEISHCHLNHGHNSIDNRHNHNHHGAERKEVEIVDFDIWINASHMIDNNWCRVFCGMNSKSGKSQSFREVLEEYTLEKGELKEIQMNKQITGWNLEQLSISLSTLVRSCGYFGNVQVSYEMMNGKIVARSNSIWMTLLNSCFCWFLLVISCLWICILPIFHLKRKQIKNRIIAQYPMLVPEQQFYYANAGSIANAVCHKKTARFHAV